MNKFEQLLGDPKSSSLPCTFVEGAYMAVQMLILRHVDLDLSILTCQLCCSFSPGSRRPKRVVRTRLMDMSTIFNKVSQVGPVLSTLEDAWQVKAAPKSSS